MAKRAAGLFGPIGSAKVLFRSILVGVLMASGPAWAGSEPAPPSLDALMNTLGYSQQDKQDLLAGKIVATNLSAEGADEIRAAVAAVLPTSLDAIAAAVRDGRNIAADPSLITFEKLDAPASAEEWAKAAFTADERAEAQKVLSAAPGSTLNLSAQEIAALDAAGRDLDDDSGAVAAASAAYRKILEDRFAAYRVKGLGGIAPYDRGDGEISSPADDLKVATQETRPILASHFPAFGRALAGFPNHQKATVSNQFYWIKTRLEGRPTFILAHQMIEPGKGFIVASHREYFVGHTYDSLQALAVMLPAAGGTAVFYIDSTSSYQLGGFFSGIAKSVGEDRLQQALTDYFQDLRKDKHL